MRTALVLLLLVFTAPLAVPVAVADAHGDCDCKGGCFPGIVDVGGRFYVDDRNYFFGNGIWIYAESNDLSGLQRGGSSVLVPGDDEICTDDSPNGPDTLLF
jgi:hypothetical protein